MALGKSRGQSAGASRKVYFAHQLHTYRARLTSIAPFEVIEPGSSERMLVDVRAVETAGASASFQLYIVDLDEDAVGVGNQYYGPAAIPSGDVFRECGSPSNPIAVIPAGYSVVVAAPSGALSVYLTVSEE